MTRLGRARETLAIGFVLVLPFVFFWQIPLGQGVWFTRDVSRVYHPFAVELSRALSAGRLPLWTPLLQAGFPLFAEGQVAALYPIHLLLVTLLPPESAISLETLLHLSWAAVGMYALARGMRLTIPSAMLAGVAFSFSGFMIQKTYHMPILWTAAWLPWLVFLFERFQRARRERWQSAGFWFLLTTLALGMQWFAGSAQIALLNSIVVACAGLIGGWTWNSRGAVWRDRLKAFPEQLLWVILPLLLGVGIGALQLLPTAELVRYSVRAGGLNDRLLTLYSYASDSLKQFIFPFSQGEPSDDNVELWGYVGITTLIGAVAALGFRRDAKTVFFAVLGFVALSLTLGDLNPAFHLLTQLPLFNLFRVPARYVLLFGFATAFLAATTLDALFQRAASLRSILPTLGMAGLASAVLGLVIVLASRQPLDFWFRIWDVMPWLLALLTMTTMGLAWAGKIDRGVLGAALVGLVTVDLTAYAAPFLSTTVAKLTPPAYVNEVPHSVPALNDPHDLSRVFTDESVWPSVPALRSSLYPNYGVVYARASAHIYSPLALSASENYFFNLTPTMLNLMNVRYFSVPLEPRAANRAPTPYASLALDVIGKEVQFAPTPALSIQIDSFTEDTSDLPADAIAANVTLRLDDGSALAFPLRLGVETADWNWEQEHQANAPPPQMRVAHPVSAFVRSVGHPFEGDVYQAQFRLGAQGVARQVVAIGVQPVAVPPVHLSIERMALVDGNGRAVSVSALTGKDDFKLAYMSDTAAIWENLNVMPRAFLVHRAEVVNQGQMLGRLRDSGFRASQTILLANGSPVIPALNVSDVSPDDHVQITRYLDERVDLSVTTNQPGFLFLGDTWYPGWEATVDGKPTPVYLADYIFRAIPIMPGQHSVVFEYRPASLVWGAAVSVLCLVLAGGVAWMLPRGLRAGERFDVGV
jgi:hypothetical protein